jgi:hypothetical protein
VRSPEGKLIEIGANVVGDGRYVARWMAEVRHPRSLSATISWMIEEPRPPTVLPPA